MPYAFFDVGSLSKGNELLFSPGVRIGRAGGRKQRQKVDARRRRGMSGAAASGNPFRAVVKILIFADDRENLVFMRDGRRNAALTLLRTPSLRELSA